MVTEYHSRLISDLYKSKDSDEAQTILDNMEEVLDISFLYPIYDSYIKHRDDSLSYVYIPIIAKIGSLEAYNLIKKIAKDPRSETPDIAECLVQLSKVSDFDKDIVARAKNIFLMYYSKEDVYFNFGGLLDYLEKAKTLLEFKEELKEIFLDPDIEKNDRRLALNYYIKTNTKETFEYFINNLASLKGSDSELILTREILAWTGPRVEKLIEKIMEEGSTGSKLLIEQKIKFKKEKELELDSKESENYSNSKQVKTIGELRKKINEISLVKFNHIIFPNDETLLLQIETVKDKNALIVNCASLRDIIQNICEEAKNRKMSHEEAVKYLDGISLSDMNKSINAFHLFLFAKGVKSDASLYGIRNIIKIVSLLGVHFEDQEVIPILKKEGLIDFYVSEQFQLLHKELLKRYAQSLESFYKSLLVFNKS